MNSKVDMRIQLNSFKPIITEICKSVINAIRLKTVFFGFGNSYCHKNVILSHEFIITILNEYFKYLLISNMVNIININKQNFWGFSVTFKNETDILRTADLGSEYTDNLL